LKHVYQEGEKNKDAHRVDGGKGRDKHKSKRPKHGFDELLAKYKKKAESNVTNRPRKGQSLPPKRKSQE
jgi:hypothetical protein